MSLASFGIGLKLRLLRRAESKIWLISDLICIPSLVDAGDTWDHIYHVTNYLGTYNAISVLSAFFCLVIYLWSSNR